MTILGQTVQYFFGILFTPGTDLKELCGVLSDAFGALDDPSEIFPFNATEYYAPEMGDSLHRVFFSLQRVAPAHEIISFKLKAMEIEKVFYSLGGKRLVNIDPGYLDPVKMVLVSTKPGGHKMALNDRFYGDMVLDYFKGQFRSFDWTFPDFKSGLYDLYFGNLREAYLKKIKNP